MKKQELVRDMKQETESSFINVTEIAKYLHSGRDAARTLVAGLEYYSSGRCKRYYVGDVADRILDRRAI